MVTVQELLEGKSTRNKEVAAYLLATIAPLRVLPYTFDIAQKAGEIARDLNKVMEFADAAIAATAIENEAELLTLNKRDFKNIKELKLADVA
jgi:predicted nucleic acid-binding protein